MRSNKSPRMSDRDILARDDDIELLRAVANGTIRRAIAGSATSTSTSIFAGHYLEGEHVRLQLQRLAREDLIAMPISGPPSLAPRGRRLLQHANGELAGPPPE
jgi:hypothetical protein